MNNAAPALLALLLVFALPATAVVAASPTSTTTKVETSTTTDVTDTWATKDPITADNTTNRLSLEGEIRSSYTTVQPDFGTALAIRDDALRTEYDTFRFETEFEDGTNAEQREMLEDEHERIANRVNKLIDREQTAVRAHVNGSLSDAQLLQRLIRITSESNELKRSLSELDQYSKGMSNSDIDVRPLRAELTTLQSPVRDRMVTSIQRAESSGQPISGVSVQTSESGLLLEMISQGDYVREITRYDNRDLTVPNQITSPSDAHEHARELYPWAFEEGSSTSSTSYHEVQLHGISVGHNHGELDIYLDGGTGAVYHDVQTLVLNQLPTEQLKETGTNESIKLAINQTPANGPIKVTLTDEETGESMNGTIYINGTIVGQTGQNGSLWVVPPNGDYELAAQTEETTVNTTVPASSLR